MKECFRYAVAILALAFLCTGCAEKQHDNEKEEQAVREATKEYREAFNSKNVEKFSSLWATDASFENPLTGEQAEGREEIAELFKEKFSSEPEKRIEIEVTSIEFPSKDEAVKKGIMKLFIPDQPTQEVAFQTALIKEDGKWVIEEFRQIEIEPTSSNFEHLQDIAFLVGTWEDTDDNVQIVLEGNWDKYKNFLTQHFKLKIYDQDDLEGRQIIAWDPVANKIRSWVYDSHGTFGEGTWAKVDKSWIVPMKYTLSDGGTATATNVYTPIDENNYKFASIDREVDGEILPNVDPVQVERVK